MISKHLPYLYRTRQRLLDKCRVGLAEDLGFVQHCLEGLLSPVDVDDVVPEVRSLLDLLPAHWALERLQSKKKG